MSQKKIILIGIDFGAMILVQKIRMNLENVWKISMMRNGVMNRREWIAEERWKNGRD